MRRCPHFRRNTSGNDAELLHICDPVCSTGLWSSVLRCTFREVICRRSPLIQHSWWFGTWWKLSQDMKFCPALLPMRLLILWLYFGLSWAFWAHLAIIMTLKGPEMSKQGIVGKRKHITLMIPLNREIIMRFESGKRWRKVMASCNIGLSTVLWYIEMGRSIMVIYGISWKCKGPFP